MIPFFLTKRYILFLPTYVHPFLQPFSRDNNSDNLKRIRLLMRSVIPVSPPWCILSFTTQPWWASFSSSSSAIITVQSTNDRRDNNRPRPTYQQHLSLTQRLTQTWCTTNRGGVGGVVSPRPSRGGPTECSVCSNDFNQSINHRTRVRSPTWSNCSRRHQMWSHLGKCCGSLCCRCCFGKSPVFHCGMCFPGRTGTTPIRKGEKQDEWITILKIFNPFIVIVVY